MNSTSPIIRDSFESNNDILRIIKRFVTENSHVTEDLITNIDFNYWQPTRIKFNSSADLKLSYFIGNVDRQRYQQAKQTYEIQYQTYQIAYNQFIQADNQYRTIRNREKDLEWHKQTNLILPRPPIEPIAPDINNFILWENTKSTELYTTSISGGLILNEGDYKFKFIDYLTTDSKVRTTRGNIFGQTLTSSKERYPEILITEVKLDNYSDNDKIKITKEIDKTLEKLFFSHAQTYMNKWYSRQLSIDNIKYRSKTIEIRIAELYVGTYNYSGKSYKIVLDTTNKIINGDLPSNTAQIRAFFLSHFTLIAICSFFNLILFNYYIEDFFGLAILCMTLNYIGFLLIANSNFLNDLIKNNTAYLISKWQGVFTRLKSLNNFSQKLKLSNSGFTVRSISMDLNKYQ
jgi:hypothetical protein